MSIVEAFEDIKINLGPIRLHEALNAVIELKNGRANGPDNIFAEMLKVQNGDAKSFLDIVNKCWSEENLPHDWKLAENVL